jgi:hypothetical protein
VDCGPVEGKCDVRRQARERRIDWSHSIAVKGDWRRKATLQLLRSRGILILCVCETPGIIYRGSGFKAKLPCQKRTDHEFTVIVVM